MKHSNQQIKSWHEADTAANDDTNKKVVLTPEIAYTYASCGINVSGQPTTMNNTLPIVKRTLHDLLYSLPAVKTHCSAEVHKRHLALIAHYQHRYDQLAASKA